MGGVRDIPDGGLELAVVCEGVCHVFVVVLQASLEGGRDEELPGDGFVVVLQTSLEGGRDDELPGDGLVELPGGGLGSLGLEG